MGEVLLWDYDHRLQLKSGSKTWDEFVQLCCRNASFVIEGLLFLLWSYSFSKNTNTI